MTHKHEVSEFERAVRRGAIINRVKWIYRMRALGLPVNMTARVRQARAFLRRER